MDILIVGGGITGLAAAHRLIELNDENNFEVTSNYSKAHPGLAVIFPPLPKTTYL